MSSRPLHAWALAHPEHTLPELYEAAAILRLKHPAGRINRAQQDAYDEVVTRAKQRGMRIRQLPDKDLYEIVNRCGL